MIWEIGSNFWKHEANAKHFTITFVGKTVLPINSGHRHKQREEQSHETVVNLRKHPVCLLVAVLQKLFGARIKRALDVPFL